VITGSEIIPLIDEIALKLLEELQKNARLVRRAWPGSRPLAFGDR
jgi:hypothetical protein